MNALTKVLVVDNGQRSVADLLSTELAEVGLSSVTTSLEAASDVLQVIERPSAIVLHMPDDESSADHAGFARLAAMLRGDEQTSGIPVIEWKRTALVAAGGLTAILRSEVGPQAVAGPEL